MLYFTLLYSLLAHPGYEHREYASDELRRLVARHPYDYGPRLSALMLSATEPEVVSRCGRIVTVYDRWRVNKYVPRSCPVWPLSDAGLRPFFFGIDLRDKHTMDEWFARAGQRSTDYGGPYWTRYRRATELWARDAIRRGVTEEEVDLHLGRMWAVERRHGSDSPDSAQAEVDSWTVWLGYPGPRYLPK